MRLFFIRISNATERLTSSVLIVAVTDSTDAVREKVEANLVSAKSFEGFGGFWKAGFVVLSKNINRDFGSNETDNAQNGM